MTASINNTLTLYVSLSKVKEATGLLTNTLPLAVPTTDDCGVLLIAAFG